MIKAEQCSPWVGSPAQQCKCHGSRVWTDMGSVFSTELTQRIYSIASNEIGVCAQEWSSAGRAHGWGSIPCRAASVLPAGLLSCLWWAACSKNIQRDAERKAGEPETTFTSVGFFGFFSCSYLKVFHNWKQGQQPRSDKLKLSCSLICQKKCFQDVSVAQWVSLNSSVFELSQGRRGGDVLGRILHRFRRGFFPEHLSLVCSVG